MKNTIAVLQDNAEWGFVFDTYRFELIGSDITGESMNKVVLRYISGTHTLYEIIKNYLLLAKGDKTAEDSMEPAETFMVKLQHGIAIVSYKELK